MLVYGMLSGVDGAIGSTYNVNGRRSRRIMELCEQNNFTEAFEVQHEANDVIERILELGIYQTLKEILNVKGIDAGTTKKPLSSFDPSKRHEVEQLVKDFDL